MPKKNEIQPVVLPGEIPDGVERFDVSERTIEKMARGSILGFQNNAASRNRRGRLNRRVETMVAKKGKHLLDKMFELAEGIYLVDKKSDKELRYYQVPPNFHAITYLLDRVLGKPAAAPTGDQREKQGIVAVEQIIKRLADGTITEQRRTILATNTTGGSDGNGHDDEGLGEEFVQE